ncbi:UDP-N-acetylmuramate--L-alanine ligase [Desulfovibrio sp. X2]|uniref:UDP-N-acetylmuramate--L-alanine ligase n=1 Tax=Desulfovibrio sp. X2 TaxID=941449 RepID=UPI0003587F70|nr:UDP-N-acetylmuramate--L-alanine ligase [Desulfovibrio sp. X2]EPR44447.1 UDP-N-acetylmuramate--L-alanine ligase [Desulfovibrio sp. X2]
MRTKVKHIHMIGIGGSGMSGIAEVLLNQGYGVSGSDVAMGPVTKRLMKLGASVFIGHGAQNVAGDVDVVVKSTAIKDDNPEVVEARERGIPVIPRAEMLAELMRLRTGVAVAGTHGKTTTTSLLAEVFAAAGYDPTVIIGGRLNAYGSNAHLGEGEYLIAEADESDGSFLCLAPIITVVTNVDADHLDHYKGGIEEIDDAFVQFMNKVPFWGMNVVCGDDPGVRRLLPRIKRRMSTYGFGKDCRIRAEVVQTGLRGIFRVFVDGEHWADVTLNQPGRHNILNALGVIGVSLEVGLAKDKVIEALSRFGGVGRRFELKGERHGVLVVDDYGHHPAEIRATLETARACYPDRRLVVAFQPHRFSRTQALFGDFCKVFENCDQLLLTEIYAASEAPIPGVSGQSLAQGIRQVSKTPVEYFQSLDEMLLALPNILRPRDLLLTLGAGSITQIGPKYLEME